MWSACYANRSTVESDTSLIIKKNARKDQHAMENVGGQLGTKPFVTFETRQFAELGLSAVSRNFELTH